MKKIFITSLAILIPLVSWGGDICTRGVDEYTTDKRCYVTEKQKNEKPYNAVVVVMRDGAVEGGDCTGTIVNDKDGKAYLYTAKHCTDLNDDGRSDISLNIKTPTGLKLQVTKSKVGNLDIKTKQNLSGDWAIYSFGFSNDILPGVNTSSFSGGGYQSVRVIGYGRLKIMSNKEIDAFRQKYITYLKSRGVEISRKNRNTYGMDAYSISAGNHNVIKFIDQLDPAYRDNIFNDTKLKESKCVYYGQNRMRECQVWNGNSGGGIFDKQGNIIGIVSYGSNVIGGIHHAELTGNVGL